MNVLGRISSKNALKVDPENVSILSERTFLRLVGPFSWNSFAHFRKTRALYSLQNNSNKLELHVEGKSSAIELKKLQESPFLGKLNIGVV